MRRIMKRFVARISAGAVMGSLIILVLVAAVILAGCSKEYQCANGKIVSDPSLCASEQKSAPAQESPTASAVAETPVLEYNIPEGIQKVLDRSKTLKSFTYIYKEVHRPLELPRTFWIKGSIVKREMPVITSILYNNKIDTAIFDRVKKTAMGYCESEKYCAVRGKVGPLDYDEYYVNTPFDWIEEIRTAEKLNSERMFDRDVWKLNVNKGEMTMWVETYYGVPLRVDVGGKRYEFTYPVFNSLTDSDVAFKERN